MPVDFITVEWKDLDGHIRDLKQFKTGIKDKVDKILYRAGLILKNEIRELITEIAKDNPKASNPDRGMLIDTGFYRQNWNLFIEHKLGLREAHVWTNTNYAEKLEGYSQKMLGYKVTEKAWERARPRIMRYLKENLDEVFDYDTII